MTNFIAFQFNDNDYHSVLQQAITHIAINCDDDLTLESWREFALRGMAAFSLIRRIDNWYAKQPMGDHTNYFATTLKVSEVGKLDELPGNFEGYVYDKNRETVFYQGY